jgi:hypothetical protein
MLTQQRHTRLALLCFYHKMFTRTRYHITLYEHCLIVYIAMYFRYRLWLHPRPAGETVTVNTHVTADTKQFAVLDLSKTALQLFIALRQRTTLQLVYTDWPFEDKVRSGNVHIT